MDRFFGPQQKVYHPRKSRQGLATRLFHFGLVVAGLSALPYVIGFAYKEPNTSKFLFNAETGIFGENAPLAKSWKRVSGFVLKAFAKVIPGVSEEYRSLDTTALV